MIKILLIFRLIAIINERLINNAILGLSVLMIIVNKGLTNNIIGLFWRHEFMDFGVVLH